MRGVSILERLAGLCDGVLQSFTQKPQSPPHREMTVAGGTASAHDSPISAPAWPEEWPPHAAARPPRRPRTCCLPRVRAACGRSVSAGCHPAPATRTTPHAALCVRPHVRLALGYLVVAHVVAYVVVHASAGSVRWSCFLALLPFPPFLPVRSTRTGKMRAFAARPGCQTVRALAADRSCDRALQLYRPSYPRYYNPPIAGQ